jgi:hypothetical protein
MRYKIYSSDGKTVKCEAEKIEYNGTFMGAVTLTVSVKSKAHKDFEIGDYIDYRGERFTLDNVPTVKKSDFKNTTGGAFEYESMQMLNPIAELEVCTFDDFVGTSAADHSFTAQPNFSFVAATMSDLAGRIQANLDRLYTGDRKWTITVADNATDKDMENMLITVNNIKVWDAIAFCKSKYGKNFIVRDRTITLGVSGASVSDIVFKVGGINGLYDLTRNSQADHDVITRLSAYGNTTNINPRYYSLINVTVTAKLTGFDYITSSHSLFFLFDLTNSTELRDKVKFSVNGSSTSYIVEGTWGIFTDYTFGDRGFAKSFAAYKVDTTEAIYNDVKAKILSDGYANTTVTFISGAIKENISDLSHLSYDVNSELPNNMNIMNLMLPGFPTKTLAEWVTENSILKTDGTNGDAVSSTNATSDSSYKYPWLREYIRAGYTFSTEKYYPYINSKNMSALGVRPHTEYFTTDDLEHKDIYPSLQYFSDDRNAVEGATTLDGNAIIDSGIFSDGATVDPIYIIIKDLGFEFDDVVINGTQPKLHFNNGYCGGRDFEVKTWEKNSDGNWKLKCGRVYDDAIGKYFPYKDAPIKAGDLFVITDIYMPESYIEQASIALLKWAMRFLAKNDYSVYSYALSVNGNFIKRHDDKLIKAGRASTSTFHYSIKEGDILLIEDSDIGISGSITIDTLKITEDSSLLPKYDITLRDTKNVGSLEKIQQQIDAITNGGSGAGYSSNQIEAIAFAYLRNKFLSKLDDDTASGLIKFLKGIGLGTDYNITEKGIATLASILSKGSADGLNGFRLTTDSNGNGHIQTDYLEVLKKAVFHELEVRKMSAVGGNIMLSPASSKVIKVEKLDASGNVTTGTAAAYKCYLKADDGTMQTQNTWKIGDQALCKTFNIKEGAYANVSNQYYWRVVTDCSSSVDADGNGYVTLSNDSNYYDTGSTEPKTEDTIVQCGYNDKYYLTVINPTDTSHASFPYSRTGVIVLESSVTSSSTVNYATRFRMLDLVTDFSLSDSLSTIVFDRDEIKISSSKFQWTTPNGDIPAVVYYGTYDATKKYDYYSEVDYAGSRWLCTNKSGAAIGEIPSESSKYWTKVKTSAVYTGTLSDYSDTIVVDADGNCVGGLWFEVGNQTDASGNIIYESDGKTPKKLVQYRLHTAVFAMRDSTHLIYQEPTDSSGNYVTPSAGHYTFTVNYDGCTGNVANGTVYITGITHVKDGVTSSDDVWTDDDYELMRSLHQCRAIITIDCEGKKSVNVEMPVTIKHTDTSYINAHLNNAMGTVLWSTAANKYTLASVSSVLTTFHDDTQLPQLSGKDTKGNDICYALILNESGTDVTSSFNVTLNIYNASTDSKNYRTEITIAPKSSSLADGKYFAYIHSATKYAGVSYEHTNLITVIKQTDGMTYQIVPSTTIVKGLWNSDGSAIGSYSPTTVSASVTASDGISTVRTLTYSEWNALGLSLAINGTTITDSVTKVTVSGTGNYECVLSLSGTIIDREVIGYNQDGQTGKDGKSVTIKGEAAEHFTSNTLCDAATKDNSLYYLIDYTSPMWTNGAYTSTNKDATALSVGDGYLIGNSLWMWTGSKWNEIKDFKGSDGKSASVTYTIEYGASATYAQDPSTLNISWSSSLPAAVSGMYLYVRTTIKIYQDANLTSTLYQYNVSRIGDDGYSYEYIYTLSASDSVGTPSFSSSDDNSAITSSKIDTNNVTWYDVPQPITSTNPYLFVSQRNGYGSARHYDSSSSSHPWSAWSTPTLWARYGKDGKDMTALVCSPDVIKLTWTYDSGTETLSGNLKPTIKLVKGDGTSTVAANASVTFEPASDTSTAPTTTTDANGQFTITSSLIVRRFKGYFLTTQNSVDIPVKQTYCDISYTINSVNYTLRVQIMVDSSAFDASFEHDSQTFHSDYSSFKTSTNNTLTAQGTSIKQNADNIALKAAQTDLNTLSNEYSALNVKANNISLKVGSWQDKLNLIPTSVWHKCLTASSTRDTIIASWDIPVTKNKNYVLSAEGKNLLIQIYDAGDNTYTAKVVGTPISIIATPVHTAASSTLSVLIYARQGTTAQFNYAQLEETAISSGTENANTAWSPCKSDKDVSDNILTGSRDLSSGTSINTTSETYTDANGNEFTAFYSTAGDDIYITDAIELGVGLYTFSFLARADVDAQTFIAGLYNSSNAVAFAFSYVASNGTSSVTTNEVTVAMSTSWMRYYITYNVTTAGTGYFEILPNDSMWFCAPKLTKCGAWDAWTNAIGYDDLLPAGLNVNRDGVELIGNKVTVKSQSGKTNTVFTEDESGNPILNTNIIIAKKLKTTGSTYVTLQNGVARFENSTDKAKFEVGMYDNNGTNVFSIKTFDAKGTLAGWLDEDGWHSIKNIARFTSTSEYYRINNATTLSAFISAGGIATIKALNFANIFGLALYIFGAKQETVNGVLTYKADGTYALTDSEASTYNGDIYTAHRSC